MPTIPFAVGEGSNLPWSAAIDSGVITPVNPEEGDELTGAAKEFYDGQGNFALVPSVLTGDIAVELGQETHESLVMQWDPLEDREIMPVAAWDLDYPEATDFSDTSLHFSLGVPKDLKTVSRLANPLSGTFPWSWLIFKANSRGWFLKESSDWLA